MFADFKSYIILGLVIIYTGIIYWVSHSMEETKSLNERIAMQQEILKTVAENKQLSEDISKIVRDGLKEVSTKSDLLKVEVKKEIESNLIYSQCRTTAGMLATYKRQQSQSKSAPSGSNDKLPNKAAGS